MDELTRYALTHARQGEALRRLMLARGLQNFSQVAAHLGVKGVGERVRGRAHDPSLIKPLVHAWGRSSDPEHLRGKAEGGFKYRTQIALGGIGTPTR